MRDRTRDLRYRYPSLQVPISVPFNEIFSFVILSNTIIRLLQLGERGERQRQSKRDSVCVKKTDIDGELVNNKLRYIQRNCKIQRHEFIDGSTLGLIR